TPSSTNRTRACCSVTPRRASARSLRSSRTHELAVRHKAVSRRRHPRWVAPTRWFRPLTGRQGHAIRERRASTRQQPRLLDKLTTGDSSIYHHFMDAERFTEAALQLIASAQQVARARQQQQVGPLHLAAALLADPTGLPSRVLQRAGADPVAARGAVDAGLAKLPVVSGSDAQFMSAELGNVFTRAEALALEW